MPVYTPDYAKMVKFWLDVDRPGELEFIDGYAQKTGGPILELASGAARVTRELARRGHGVYGVEMSAPMLDKAREVLGAETAEVRDRIHLVQGDMTRFAFRRQFPLICIPFYSFWHNLDEAGADRCVQCMVDHLAPGGFFLVEGEMDYDIGQVRGEFWQRTSERLGFFYRRERYQLRSAKGYFQNSAFLVGWRA